MNILVGNNALANLGGSETYAYTLVEELVRRGHTVSCIGKKGGIVSDELRKLNVRVYFKPISETFDLMLLSHTTSIAMTKACKGFKMQTCHGIFPLLEQPVSGMDAYVSISKEVKEHLQKKGINSTIIWNGVNCERYKSVTPINSKLQTALSLTHSKVANALLRDACHLLEIDLIIHDKYKNPIWDVENEINNADLVVSLGRGAYEAMACGRNVVIFDNRTYAGMQPFGDGILTKVNAPHYLQNNCSGRFSNKMFDVAKLYVELKKYKRSNGKDLRRFALENLNIVKQVDKYLELVR